MSTVTRPRDLASKRPANVEPAAERPAPYPAHRSGGGRLLRRYVYLLAFLLVIGYAAGFLGWL